MRNGTRERQRLIYMEMWRAYYAVIILASGAAITYAGAQSGNFLFALGVAVLTIAAIIVLFARTFRRARRRAAIPSNARRPWQ